MHTKTARFIIAGGNNATPVATATDRNGTVDQAGVVAHFYRSEKTISITVNNFAHDETVKDASRLNKVVSTNSDTVLKHSALLYRQCVLSVRQKLSGVGAD